ncbi:hypothetical protein CERSUDRAFT_116094 [Gelatoporia subvermispora B]|uniref:Uncharacterized protein n=1 Tax=Ceriporiopsis subvermispora (strain B) TaxID=914234 RepID=M2RA22_CERS8|nr:hypothetical protein CERSUDRAFT_116094 [Gelatoporia subvermispora B]
MHIRILTRRVDEFALAGRMMNLDGWGRVLLGLPPQYWKAGIRVTRTLHYSIDPQPSRRRWPWPIHSSSTSIPHPQPPCAHSTGE